MLRNDSNFLMKRALTCSIALHFLLLIFGCISVMWPIFRKELPMDMDIEIASEGELQKALASQPMAFETKEELLPTNAEKQIIKEAEQLLQSRSKTSPLDIQEEKDLNNNEDSSVLQNNLGIPVPIEKQKKEEVLSKQAHKKIRQSLQSIVRKIEKEEKRKKLERAKISAKKEKEDNEFSKMLGESISDLPTSPKQQSSGKGKKNHGLGFFGSCNGISENDYNIISSQVYPHWVVPAGVKDAESIIIEIRVKLKDNGEVIPSGVKIVNMAKYDSDYIFRAAADSAKRAILQASPFTVPKGKINLFREFVFKFNLKEALGG